MEFQFDSFAAFIHMGGHGKYVWASYLVTFVALLGLVLQPIIARKKFKKQFASLMKRKAVQQQNEQNNASS